MKEISEFFSHKRKARAMQYLLPRKKGMSPRMRAQFYCSTRIEGGASLFFCVTVYSALTHARSVQTGGETAPPLADIQTAYIIHYLWIKTNRTLINKTFCSIACSSVYKLSEFIKCCIAENFKKNVKSHENTLFYTLSQISIVTRFL